MFFLEFHASHVEKTKRKKKKLILDQLSFERFVNDCKHIQRSGDIDRFCDESSSRDYIPANIILQEIIFSCVLILQIN